MTIGEGTAFAALMWAVVQVTYLIHNRSRMVTVDEVKERLDRITRYLESMGME